MHSVATTKEIPSSCWPLPSSLWPLPSHYQAPFGHYQAIFGNYQAPSSHYQALFGNYQAPISQDALLVLLHRHLESLALRRWLVQLVALDERLASGRWKSHTLTLNLAWRVVKMSATRARSSALQPAMMGAQRSSSDKLRAFATAALCVANSASRRRR